MNGSDVSKTISARPRPEENNTARDEEHTCWMGQVSAFVEYSNDELTQPTYLLTYLYGLILAHQGPHRRGRGFVSVLVTHNSAIIKNSLMYLLTYLYYYLLIYLFIFMGSFYLVNLILAIVAMSYDDCQKQDLEDEEAEEDMLVGMSLSRSLLYVYTKPAE